MDTRDFELLRHLRDEPLATFEHYGQLLGLSGNAARLRFEALVDEGVTTGVEVLVAGEALGRETWTTFLRGVESAAHLQDAFGCEAAVLTTYYPEGHATVSTYTRREEAPRLPEVFTALGFQVQESRPAPWRPTPGVSPPAATDKELRVMGALVDDPRRSTRDIAKVAGCSPRTAAGLRDSLRSRGLIEILPLLRLGWARGICFYKLTVIADRATVDGVLRDDPELARYWPLHDPEGAVLVGRAPSIAEAYLVERRVASTAGVSRATIAFNADLVYDRKRVSAIVQRELRRRAQDPKA
jgi:DNA-binding Lrp family transcriptional regulator